MVNALFIDSRICRVINGLDPRELVQDAIVDVKDIGISWSKDDTIGKVVIWKVRSGDVGIYVCDEVFKGGTS